MPSLSLTCNACHKVRLMTSDERITKIITKYGSTEILVAGYLCRDCKRPVKEKKKQEEKDAKEKRRQEKREAREKKVQEKKLAREKKAQEKAGILK